MNENQINLLGLMGKMRAGKSMTARIIQYLTQQHNEIPLEQMLVYDQFKQPPTTEWEIKSFAGKLKQCVSLVTGISLEDLEKQEVKAGFLSEEWNLPGRTQLEDARLMTVREMLQQFGTQGGRAIHPDFWVNSLFADYKPTLTNKSKDNLQGFLSRPKQYRETIAEYKIPKWIVADCRFVNEVEAIKRNGGILIKITRPETDILAGDHLSETALDSYSDFDYMIVNDGDINQLVDNVGNVLKKAKII